MDIYEHLRHGMNICGNFTQLPPVDKDGSRRSLAVPLDDLGEPDIKDNDDEEVNKNQSA